MFYSKTTSPQSLLLHFSSSLDQTEGVLLANEGDVLVDRPDDATRLENDLGLRELLVGRLGGPLATHRLVHHLLKLLRRRVGERDALHLKTARTERAVLLDGKRAKAAICE